MSLYANNINVTVSILPQKYFVEKIAGEKVKVNVMVRSGFSPATYEPQTSQMKILSKSKAYFSIGVPFESAWLTKFENTNKNMLIVDTTKGINKLEMIEHEHHDDHKVETHKKEPLEHDDHDEEPQLDFSTTELQEFSIQLAQASSGVINKTSTTANTGVIENEIYIASLVLLFHFITKTIHIVFT